jgi:hypothetical protein
MTKRQDLCLQRRSRPEQSDQRQPNQAANISHQPRASSDSTSLASRIEFPTVTGVEVAAMRGQADDVCAWGQSRPSGYERRLPNLTHKQTGTPGELDGLSIASKREPIMGIARELGLDRIGASERLAGRDPTSGRRSSRSMKNLPSRISAAFA